jgi:hypothetical protein
MRFSIMWGSDEPKPSTDSISVEDVLTDEAREELDKKLEEVKDEGSDETKLENGNGDGDNG